METPSDYKPWYYWKFSKHTTVLLLMGLGLFLLVFQVNKLLSSSFRIEIFGVEILEVKHFDEAPVAEEAPVIRERRVFQPRAPLPPLPPLPPVPETPEAPRHTYVVVEQMPELIGGLGSIQRQVRYPELAKRAGIEGRVIIQFVVDKYGGV